MNDNDNTIDLDSVRNFSAGVDPERAAFEKWRKGLTTEQKASVDLFDRCLPVGQKVLRVAASMYLALEGTVPEPQSGRPPLQLIFRTEEGGIQVPDVDKARSLLARVNSLGAALTEFIGKASSAPEKSKNEARLEAVMKVGTEDGYECDDCGRFWKAVELKSIPPVHDCKKGQKQ